MTQMTFKQSNKSDLNKWRVEHLEQLQRAGMPQEIVVDNRRFWFVVQEGDDQLQTGWNPNWISADQAQKLLDLLSDALEDSTGWDLVLSLRRRIDR